MDVQIHPLEASFGAEVVGIDWSPPTPELVSTLTQALRSKLLLVFRGQPSPSHDEMTCFFGAFGPLVLHTYDGAFHYSSSFSDSANDYVHRRMDGHYIVNTATGGPELSWHNDQSHRPRLKKLSFLEAVDCEEGAVPTYFRDMYVAHEMLPRDVRLDLSSKQASFLNPHLPAVSEQPRLCDAMHLVGTQHPDSGRTALYVNSHTDRIVGLSNSESEEMLAYLGQHIERHAPTYQHQWRDGDLVIWDNIGLQHRRDELPVGQRRVLRSFEGVSE